MSIDLLATPNELLAKLTGKDYLSYSAISCFRTCSLRWFYHYAEKLPEETVSAALVHGGAIHAAAELHFRELMAGCPAPDVDSALNVYLKGMAFEFAPGVRRGLNHYISGIAPTDYE